MTDERKPKKQNPKSDTRRFVDSEVDGVRITPPPKPIQQPQRPR